MWNINFTGSIFYSIIKNSFGPIYHTWTESNQNGFFQVFWWKWAKTNVNRSINIKKWDFHQNSRKFFFGNFDICERFCHVQTPRFLPDDEKFVFLTFLNIIGVPCNKKNTLENLPSTNSVHWSCRNNPEHNMVKND